MGLRDPKCAVLRLTIEGVEPSIWRRVVVPRDWRLGDLHRLIQAAFGWSGAHAHEFILAGLSFSSSPVPASADTASRVYEEDDVRLRDMLGRDVEFSYEYEVGAHWLVAIVIEDLLWNERGPDGARCIAGARAGPPEDSAGPEAYAAALAAIRDLGRPGHDPVGRRQKARRRWLHNPEAFDLDVVDRRVARIVPPKRPAEN